MKSADSTRWCLPWLASLLIQAAANAQSSPAPREALGDRLAREARARYTDPAIHDRLTERLRDGRFLRFLEGVGVSLRAFDSDSDGDVALGLRYDLAKTLVGPEFEEDPSFDLVVHGNLAFDYKANPDALLTSMFRLRWFGGSTWDDGVQSRKEAMEALKPAAEATLRELAPQSFAKLSALAAQDESNGSLQSDPDYRALQGRFDAAVRRTLPTEIVWDTDLHAGLESTQTLSSRQFVLGMSYGTRLIAWNPDSAASRFNVLDFPAAALRWIAGRDEDFRASGLAYPFVVAGLDVVMAGADDERGAITDDETFLRGRLELASRSQLFELADEMLHLNLGWRYFQEFDAPAAVRRVDTDEASFFEAGIELPRGWSLTYSAGKLPLDTQEDSTFALGYSLQF